MHCQTTTVGSAPGRWHCSVNNRSLSLMVWASSSLLVRLLTRREEDDKDSHFGDRLAQVCFCFSLLMGLLAISVI